MKSLSAFRIPFTTVALSLGHALTVILMEARGFGPAEFAHLHAGGQLGRNLKLRVQDVMHTGGEVAWVSPNDCLLYTSDAADE